MAYPGGGKVKMALQWPNVANIIAIHLYDRYRKLCDHLADPTRKSLADNVWFTGSRVWKWLYTDTAKISEDSVIGKQGIIPWDTDLDIIMTMNGWDGYSTNMMTKVYPGHVFMKTNHVNINGKINTGTKYNGTPLPLTASPSAPASDTIIDIWGEETIIGTSISSNIEDMLQKYPAASHGHCMAAFSLTKGLVVLPNSLGWKLPALPQSPIPPSNIKGLIP